MTTPTEEQFVAAVDAVLDERGDDYGYRAPEGVDGEPACVYNANPEKGVDACLFGAAFASLGLEVSEANEGLDAATVARFLRIDLSLNTADAANHAQDKQDMGMRYADVRETWNRKLGRDKND